MIANEKLNGSYNSHRLVDLRDLLGHYDAHLRLRLCNSLFVAC